MDIGIFVDFLRSCSITVDLGDCSHDFFLLSCWMDASELWLMLGLLVVI